MDIEIIKTNDSNIVIERTTIDKEINLSFLLEEKEGCITRLAEYDVTIDRLKDKALEVDEELKTLIFIKISDIQVCKYLDEQQLLAINEKLK